MDSADSAPVDVAPTDDVVLADDPRPFDDASLEGTEAATLERLRRLSYYLDDLVAVPGTDIRVGLDPLVGLIPGVGDLPTSLAAAYVVAEAAALGVPRETLARMVLNLFADAVVGSVPVVGDVFDALFKANQRNVRLLEARIDTPESATLDRRYVLGVTLLLAGLLVAIGAGIALATVWVLGRLGVV